MEELIENITKVITSQKEIKEKRKQLIKVIDNADGLMLITPNACVVLCHDLMKIPLLSSLIENLYNKGKLSHNDLNFIVKKCKELQTKMEDRK